MSPLAWMISKANNIQTNTAKTARPILLKLKLQSGTLWLLRQEQQKPHRNLYLKVTSFTQGDGHIFVEIDWGVSEHHKASLDPIFFWKHQCALMDHNNFMKQKGSIIFILNHSEFFFEIFFYIFVAFWSFFFMPENFFLLQDKLSCNVGI